MSYLPYALPLGSLVLALPYLRQRLQLSRAKHRSLAGHSRMAKRLASWLPGYAYDEGRFFDCDGAPEDIARLRRASFDTLSAGFAQRYARSLALSAEAREGLADLQFTGSYRVPFQFSPIVRERLKVGAFVQSAEGITVTDLDGNRFIDLTGSYGVNVFGVDFYGRGRADRRSTRPGAGRLPPLRRGQHRAPEGDLGPGAGVVPHVGHRGGDAGRAPGALPHAAQEPGALLRRVPRLVGGRAARPRQPDAAARDLHAQGHGRQEPAGAALAARHRLRAGQPAAGPAPQPQRARRLHAGGRQPQRGLRPRGLHRLAEATARGLHRARHRADLRRGVPGLSPRPRWRAGIFRCARRPRDLRQDAGGRVPRWAWSAAVPT